MQFSLKKLLAIVVLISLVVFGASVIFRVHHERTIAQGIRHANETWENNATIYEWPTRTTTSGSRQILHFVDRQTGLRLINEPDGRFSRANNSEVRKLLDKNGPQKYAIDVAEKLPTDRELENMFSSAEMKLVQNFPVELTDSIRLEFTDRLEITTTGPEFTGQMYYAVDFGDPVYTSMNESIIYVRSGNYWLGVFLRDGRLLFEVF